MKPESIKPQPRVNDLNRPFWDGCNDGRLVIQRCPACARAVFYPRVCCPHCQNGELDWITASGRGRIISHTTVYRTHHDGFNTEAPYVFVAVELDEGPTMYGQLVDVVPGHQPVIGQSVSAVFVEHGREQKIAAFRLTA
jgi:uncharacterized OB-fold protein